MTQAETTEPKREIPEGYHAHGVTYRAAVALIRSRLVIPLAQAEAEANEVVATNE